MFGGIFHSPKPVFRGPDYHLFAIFGVVVFFSGPLGSKASLMFSVFCFFSRPMASKVRRFNYPVGTLGPVETTPEYFTLEELRLIWELGQR